MLCPSLFFLCLCVKLDLIGPNILWKLLCFLSHAFALMKKLRSSASCLRELTCQKFSTTTLLWHIISFYESRVDTAQRLRGLRAEWAKQRSCIKPGSRGTGRERGGCFLCFPWSNSPEELAGQHPQGQGPGHWSVTPKRLLWQPKQAADFTASGNKLKQEISPVSFTDTGTCQWKVPSVCSGFNFYHPKCFTSSTGR